MLKIEYWGEVLSGCAPDLPITGLRFSERLGLFDTRKPRKGLREMRTDA